MDEAWMEALRELGLQNCAYTLLQEKDGIRVARVWRQGCLLYTSPSPRDS